MHALLEKLLDQLWNYFQNFFVGLSFRPVKCPAPHDLSEGIRVPAPNNQKSLESCWERSILTIVWSILTTFPLIYHRNSLEVSVYCAATQRGPWTTTFSAKLLLRFPRASLNDHGLLCLLLQARFRAHPHSVPLWSRKCRTKKMSLLQSLHIPGLGE